VLGGDFGGVDLVDAEAGAGVVQLVPPGGADMRGWVDVGRGRGCMVVGGGVDMCARQLFGTVHHCSSAQSTVGAQGAVAPLDHRTVR
jgi:hypothetical protein